MNSFYDVIVVGTGVAGLYTCLNIDKNKKVLLLTKDEVLNSDSYLAQGGIATLHDDEDFNAYYADTMRAGRYENNEVAVIDMINQSRNIICDLIDKGTQFDKRSGELEYTREGGHSIHRILHHKDITGNEITTTLYNRVRELSNVEIVEHTIMLDILVNNDRCSGVVCRLPSGDIVCVNAYDVVLATGGLGGLFKNSTNFAHITGDALSIAINHDVKINNIDYIQIHPTVLSSKAEGRKFLISESIRGEGATLHNEVGERFVDELLPRDIVSAAILAEMEKYSTDHVYLDCSAIENSKLLAHFPNICERCGEDGYDLSCERIPVVPAQHYMMGGIASDIHGVTSLAHLYAVGECAGNGVHGANRLASNSLLESLTFSLNCAKQINNNTSDSVDNTNISIDSSNYSDLNAWYESSKNAIMSEIKKNNEVFYDKWCNDEDNC